MKDVIISLFADDIIMCTENSKDSTIKTTELIMDFSKLIGFKDNTQISIVFFIC